MFSIFWNLFVTIKNKTSENKIVNRTLKDTSAEIDLMKLNLSGLITWLSTPLTTMVYWSNVPPGTNQLRIAVKMITKNTIT